MSENPESVKISVLHDLVLLYLAFAHGPHMRLRADARCDIAFKLGRWVPDRDPALLDHIVREAMLSYIDRPGQEFIRELAERLGRQLPYTLKGEVIEDLQGISRITGRASVETELIAYTASIWKYAIS